MKILKMANKLFQRPVFRWGIHLYMSFFLSISSLAGPSVEHHISGTVHHVIMIFSVCHTLYISRTADHIIKVFGTQM